MSSSARPKELGLMKADSVASDIFNPSDTSAPKVTMAAPNPADYTSGTQGGPGGRGHMVGKDPGYAGNDAYKKAVDEYNRQVGATNDFYRKKREAADKYNAASAIDADRARGMQGRADTVKTGRSITAPAIVASLTSGGR